MSKWSPKRRTDKAQGCSAHCLLVTYPLVKLFSSPVLVRVRIVTHYLSIHIWYYIYIIIYNDINWYTIYIYNIYIYIYVIYIIYIYIIYTIKFTIIHTHTDPQSVLYIAVYSPSTELWCPRYSTWGGILWTALQMEGAAVGMRRVSERTSLRDPIRVHGAGFLTVLWVLSISRAWLRSFPWKSCLFAKRRGTLVISAQLFSFLAFLCVFSCVQLGFRYLLMLRVPGHCTRGWSQTFGPWDWWLNIANNR